MKTTLTPPNSSFVWTQAEPNETPYVLFKRTFSLSFVPEKAPFLIFADSRYRLHINGQIIAYGPARFHPSRPEYDCFELSPHLKSGENTILVEVWHVTENNYQIQEHQAGFIASGEIQGIDLGTPGAWTYRIDSSRSLHPPIYSFAMPNTEICDWPEHQTLIQSEEGWKSVKLVEKSDWGPLNPRSTDIPAFTIQSLAKPKYGVITETEIRHAFHYHSLTKRINRREVVHLIVATRFISPRDQELELALFWGLNTLNGERLQMKKDSNFGNRETVTAHFNKGENLLYSELELLGTSWGHQMGYPISAQLVINNGSSTNRAFLVSKEIKPEQRPSVNSKIPKNWDELQNLDIELLPQETDQNKEFPSRQVAWDSPKSPLAFLDSEELFLKKGKHILLFDVGSTFTGHPVFEVQTTGNATLDVSYDEVLRPDGCIDIYASNHLVNSTDRYQLKSGQHQVEVLPERGGRYIQLNIQVEKELTVAHAGVRLSTLNPVLINPIQDPSDFQQALVKLCQSTLMAGYGECFTDSPWREQGMYLGDHYVQGLALRSILPDTRAIERSLRVFADCQHDNGQIPAVCPGHYRGQHEDFSLIWILLLEEVWTLSGNLELVKELWPTLVKILNSDMFIHKNGLVGAHTHFIDWGVLKTCKASGEVSSLVSAFYIGALQAASNLANALGKSQEAQALSLQKRNMAQQFQSQFWDQTNQCIRYSVPSVDSDGIYCLHSNILALLYEVVHPDQKQLVLNSIKKNLEQQLLDPASHQQFDGHIELYFSFFAFRVLAKYGEHELIEKFIQTIFGLMIDRNVPNLWECYCRGLYERGSQCHGWSASPIIYIAEEWLGIHYPEPGNPNHILISPSAATLNKFSGTYPHHLGNIEVTWQWNDSESLLTLEVTAPQSLQIEVQLGPIFQHGQLSYKINTLSP